MNMRRSGGAAGMAAAAALAASNGAFLWSWSNAAARTAQGVTAAQLGCSGFQADMALAFKLISVSPTVWERQDDKTMSTWRYAQSTPSAGILAVGCSFGAANNGTFVQKAVASTTKATSMVRHTATVSAATAAATFYSRAANIQQAVWGSGYRTRIKTCMDTPSANMKWFFGIGDVIGAPTTVVTPQSQTDCMLIGRDTETNLQVYTNDNGGTCTQVDCGVLFPAITVNVGYDAEFYAPPGGASISWMVTNINTGDCVSGTFSTNLPIAGAPMLPCNYVTNGTDAVQVGVGYAWQGYQAKEQ